MKEKHSKVDQVKALRLARSAEKSDGGVKESPASTPDYNGVKSPALVTAHGLSVKSRPLKQVTPAPSVAKRGRPRLGEKRPQPWIDAKMSRATWYRRKNEAK